MKCSLHLGNEPHSSLLRLCWLKDMAAFTPSVLYLGRREAVSFQHMHRQTPHTAQRTASSCPRG